MSLMERILQEENLYAAWRKVRANQGGPGMDAVTLDDFEENLPAHLADLANRLDTETYVPLPLRRASLPKPGNKVRELAIPAIVDRVAQRAFLNVLEPLIEPHFLPCSFGYRPQRGVSDAVALVLRYRDAGLTWILDADVRDFFPSVDHALLMERFRGFVRDRAVERVISLWLEAGILSEEGETSPTLLSRVIEQARHATQALFSEDSSESDRFTEEADFATQERQVLLRRFGSETLRLAWEYRRILLPLLSAKVALVGGGVTLAAIAAALLADRFLVRRKRPTGTPQGSPLSPLLSNLYLHSFDERMTKTGLRLVRYADDFVVCCPSVARAHQARAIAEAELTRLRLSLHSEKTRIVGSEDILRFLGHEFDGDGAFPLPKSEEPTTRTRAEANVSPVRARISTAGKRVSQVGKSASTAAQEAAREIHERIRELRDGRNRIE